jgi:hypothetical protein
MTYSFLGSNCRNLAVIAVTAAAIAASACSGNIGSSASPISDRAVRRAATLSWGSWIEVVPFSGDPTEVTGINSLTGSASQIVGFYTVNASSSKAMSYSFTSNGTSYSAVTPASYPLVHNGTQSGSSTGTQMNSIPPESSGVPSLAGWVNDPGNECGDWPVADNQGLWTLESKGAGGTSATARLFGINDGHIAVGYQAALTSSNKCGLPSTTNAAYFLTGGDENAVNFGLTGSISNSVAYGINDFGDMVGTATVNKVPEGWYALCIDTNSKGEFDCPTSGTTSGNGHSAYCWNTLNDPSGSDTVAYGISGVYKITAGATTMLIVGSYFNTGDKATHGFLIPVTLTRTTTSFSCQPGSFQDIKEKNAVHGTVVRGVNDEGYIVGYYMDGHNNTDGFVGIPGTGTDRRRSHR